jgi:murein DD-endopeptidase MepM/ murein hydrolase activator NlpD
LRKYNWVLLLCFLMVGCAEQNPARVVEITPSTYKVLAKKKIKNSHVALKMNKSSEKPEWVWPVPARGNILSRFSATNPKLKGIDIAGQEGTPVVAASGGEVVYSGNSLQGYGNLVIIKHKNNYLTAYAHNRKNMVKEGDRVVVGQRIAEMGRSGTNRVQLHFEVRHQGSPIDPQAVLPKN